MELDVYSTDIDWVPISKGINDSFAIGFVDGSFKLITKLTKVEKHVVDAHKAAVNYLFSLFIFNLYIFLFFQHLMNLKKVD